MPKTNNIIHIAEILPFKMDKQLLILKKCSHHEYEWYLLIDGKENATNIKTETANQAIQLARKKWSLNSFRSIDCGKRFTLPERDEHGTPALYYQMKASYESLTGIYFDNDLGHNCIVKEASQEALDMMHHLPPDSVLDKIFS